MTVFLNRSSNASNEILTSKNSRIEDKFQSLEQHASDSTAAVTEDGGIQQHESKEKEHLKDPESVRSSIDIFPADTHTQDEVSQVQSTSSNLKSSSQFSANIFIRRPRLHNLQSDTTLSDIYKLPSFLAYTNLNTVVASGHRKLKHLPQIQASQIQDMWAVGQGSFGSVHCVSLTCPSCGKISNIKTGSQKGLIHARETEHEKYVMKKLIIAQEDKTDLKSANHSLMDLIIETHFLAALDHPHIVKIKGVASSTTLAKDFFLIMERLNETLSVRIHTKWANRQYQLEKSRDMMRSRKHYVPSVFRRKFDKKLNSLWRERLFVANGIIQAISHLHELGVMHRDIKPKNIGFDEKGQVKLFDFGTALQLTSSDRIMCAGSRVGSRRYMAPEVYNRQPYTFSADVYSFTLVLWEMLMYRKPEDWNVKEETVGCPLERPSIPADWSAGIHELITLCCSHRAEDRLSAREISSVLEKEMKL